MAYVSKTGKVAHIRIGVQEGAGWGPPEDFIATHVVVILSDDAGLSMDEGYYGFDLRPGPDLPASLAMLATLRDAFMNGLKVGLSCKVEPGKKAGRIVHVDVERELSELHTLTGVTGAHR